MHITGCSSRAQITGTDGDAKPFDFLIDGGLLRGSLVEYIDQQQGAVTTENVVNVEVIESMAKPEPSGEHEHDDWISSVDIGGANG